MDTSKTITHVGLCAGYGGIELGLKRAIPNLRSVALCEIEAFAIANLVAKMEAGQMDPAPVWSDLKTFPWSEFCDRVDILTGGYPCQPFSAAGNRGGSSDLRHLWPHIASGIRVLKPGLCFFENVEGHITLGLRNVIEDLESMGYGATWGIFSAGELGAPHQRKRVFILAVQKKPSDTVRERGQLSIERIQSAVENTGSAGTPWRTERKRNGWPIEPVVRGVDDGIANRVDRLRLLGNGVVPATAEFAFRTLWREITPLPLL